MSMKTPFFSAFGSLLFGRRAHRKLPGMPEDLSLLRGVFGSHVPKGALAQARSGPNSRRRFFSTDATFWAFLFQVLSPACACREVVRKLQAWWTGCRRKKMAAGTGRCSVPSGSGSRIAVIVLMPAKLSRGASRTKPRVTRRALHSVCLRIGDEASSIATDSNRTLVVADVRRRPGPMAGCRDEIPFSVPASSRRRLQRKRPTFSTKKNASAPATKCG